MSYSDGLKINRPHNLNFVPHSKVLEKWTAQPDSFQRTNGAESFEDKEIARLFPNGELTQIYNKIADDYGLEKAPTLELIKDFEKKDRGFYNAYNNSIKIVLDFLKPESRKFLIEKDGRKFYMTGDSRGLLFRDKSDAVESEKKSLESMGFKVTTEPLTDDDKKKLMVFFLAHELTHAYQNQVIRHTEGLNEWEMIKTRFDSARPKRMNLIEQGLFYIETKQIYDKTHAGMSFEKTYSENSQEGRQAKIWYDANAGYKRPENDYKANITNPLETHANDRAYEYLKNNFGYFENAIHY